MVARRAPKGINDPLPAQTTNPRDPCTQILPTLGPNVCKYYLHWAIWILRAKASTSTNNTAQKVTGTHSLTLPHKHGNPPRPLNRLYVSAGGGLALDS